MRGAALMLAMGVLAAPAVRADDCLPAPEAVVSLGFDSRYAEGSETRSEIDPEAEADAEDALAPIDDFLRELTDEANAALEEGSAEGANCVVGRIAQWARADALSDLGSETAQLTIGSRLAGFALALMQVRPLATRPEDVAEVDAWLDRRLREQMVFWEEEAPPGARRGNLRAWAALAAAAAADGRADADPLSRAWATWSVGYVLCTAAPDGSLPQEMARGRLALRYQLHALAPLVVATALLERQGEAVAAACDGAIHRAVGFALGDLATGEATRAITGEEQSLVDGSDEVEDFQLAFLEAYLTLGDSPARAAAEAAASSLRPLGYSKLGGDQTLLWGRPG